MVSAFIIGMRCLCTVVSLQFEPKSCHVMTDYQESDRLLFVENDSDPVFFVSSSNLIYIYEYSTRIQVYSCILVRIN